MLCKSELQKKARAELSSKAKSAAAAALELEFFCFKFFSLTFCRTLFIIKHYKFTRLLAKIKHFNHLTIAQCRFLRKFDIINFCGLALVERQFNPCKMISNYVWFHCLQKDFSKRITGVDPFGPAKSFGV